MFYDDKNLIKLTKKLFLIELDTKTDIADQKTCSINKTLDKISKWKKDGSIVVFIAGVFDILHLNHLIALEYYRLLGAKKLLERYPQITTPIAEIACSNKIRLVVSIDSDLRVSENKFLKSNQKNTKRPALSWRSRTMMLLKQSFDDHNGNSHNLVDLAVRHGKDTCQGKRCPHDDNILIAEEINPDVMILNQKSLESIKLTKQSKLFKDTKVYLIDENQLTLIDDLLVGPIKTTAILERVASHLTQLESKK